jgi:RNA polymerase sigma factor (sigma-70 family)
VEQRADNELVEQARAGDRQAFNLLVERYEPLALRVALGMVGQREVAEELAQEALLQAYLSLDRLRDGASFRSWLWGIVRNLCRSHARQHGAALLSLESLAGGMVFDAERFARPADPQRLVEEREEQRQVLAALARLAPQDRAAMELFYCRQLTLQEVAAQLGSTPGSVKVRLHRCRKQLREQLAPGRLTRMPAARPRRRRKEMARVTIADVLQKEETGHCVVVLVDEEKQRALPVWIGTPEAVTIAINLTGFPVARPMTFQFVASLLEATGGALEEVRIQELKENTFYAVARLRAGDRVRELDCRPSDALALAQRLDAPVYVADEILASFGMEVPAEWRGLGEKLAEQLAAGPEFRHPIDLLKEMGERLGGGMWSLVRAYSV